MLHPDLKTRETASGRAPEEALAEAVALGVALPGLEVIGHEVVPLPKTRAGTLFGTGKIEELRARLKTEEVELVLIDGPVTPVQQRNLEKEWKVKILDRTGLILEIFSDRAATREGVLQVELAALSYQRTRLVRAWTHLERQRGGLGFVGGPGETQIEADRRAIDERINKIKTQLSKTVKTRELHRAARAKVPFPIVALVGYTNAGKSTLFNRLTGADVMVKDMLFATLDPTMRSVELPDGVEIIMSDTVGFISDLPTQLVAAFRATLEEVLSADLILHVRDISHPETESQAADVRAILGDLGVADSIKTLEVWNKLDLVDGDLRESLSNKAERDEAIFLTSALTGAGMDALLAAVSREVTEATTDEVLTLGFDEGKKRAWLFEQEVVTSEGATEAGFELSVTWSAKQKARFEKL
ncbi:MAG: GTPase HflX [Pseudomonadota bacterium]